MNRLKIVLDTNVVLSSLGRHSSYKILIDSLLAGSYDLYVTTEILFEYEEKINDFFDPITAQFFLDSLNLLPNVYFSTTHYRFLLITHDADDDKFADCAIAEGVHFLVTNDNHFNVLSKLGFPKVNLLKINDFKEILENITI